MNKEEEESEFKRKFDILWRGVYGDLDNKVPGIVDEIQYLKKIKKGIYVGIGILGTIQVLFWLIDKLHLKLF